MLDGVFLLFIIVSVFGSCSLHTWVVGFLEIMNGCDTKYLLSLHKQYIHSMIVYTSLWFPCSDLKQVALFTFDDLVVFWIGVIKGVEHRQHIRVAPEIILIFHPQIRFDKISRMLTNLPTQLLPPTTIVISRQPSGTDKAAILKSHCTDT